MSKRFNQSFAQEVQDAFMEPPEIEKKSEKCPFLVIKPFEACETEKEKTLWMEINQFATETSEKFKQNLREILETHEYSGKKGIPPKIIEHLEINGLLYPDFKFSFGSEGEALLEKVGLDDRISQIEEYEGILLFQLPANLAKFWWKFTEDSSFSFLRHPADSMEPLHDTVIEWGTIYGKIMPTIWDMVAGYISDERIGFQRLNEYGEHSPEEYYYVWLID
jgi:hypothetical protein